MRSEDKGQNLILVMILIFILILTSATIPVEHSEMDSQKKAQARWILRPWLAKLIMPAPKKSSPIKIESISKEDTSQHVAEQEEHVVKQEESSPEPEPEPEPEPVKKVVQKTEPVSEDIILMNNAKYAKHTKPIVRFTHQVHIDKYSKSCGECHHDDKGAPLEIKQGDNVTDCIECHKGTKTVKGEKLKRPEKIMKYHKEALHANCIDCHKANNIEKGDPKGKSPAPVSCKKCHIKI